ncbi:DUF1484 family protein [Chromobacterium alkanivorans]|uniref:DUF1484 family protein n=1 Tax=Chromobacterium alkanivorans TaxID=1071719 RepID=UPI0019673790|nr:DUF1484 family protein [Chromobacterium alkanivorans]MBN3003458.1 DUF1484 family protein [Chromobacterium alkanivorans]
MDGPMPVMEQLKQLNQDLLDAQPDQTALSHLGRQLAQQCAEMDACLLQGLMELRAANIGLQAILTLLQLHDEPVLVSSDEAVALLEPIQQRLSLGLNRINQLL